MCGSREHSSYSATGYTQTITGTSYTTTNTRHSLGGLYTITSSGTDGYSILGGAAGSNPFNSTQTVDTNSGTVTSGRDIARALRKPPAGRNASRA